MPTLTKLVAVLLDEPTYRALLARAEDEGRTVSDVLRRLVRAALKEDR